MLGDMDIGDFAERFHITVPEGDYSTLGGLIESIATEPILAGSEHTWNGVIFHIDEIKDGAATNITLEMNQAYEEDDPTQEQEPDTEEVSL